MNLQESVEESIANEIADKASPETRRSYEHVWRFYRAWLAEQNLEATAVRPKHVQAYIAHLRLKGQVKGTIGRALSAVHQLYSALVRDELMQTNPAREVKGPKMDSTPKAPWIREESDAEKLLNVAGESLFAGIDSGPLFPRRPHDRRPVNGGIVYHVVRKMCAKAGIEVVPPHALRRSYITWSGIKEVSLKERQLAVGHSSSSTTERYDRARNAARTKVGNVFASLVHG